MERNDIDEQDLFFQDSVPIEGVSPEQEDDELFLSEGQEKGFASPQFAKKDSDEYKKTLKEELKNHGKKMEQQNADHKAQVEQLKGINWATKYHLVYSKIECALSRMLCIITTKQKYILQRRFERYRQIASFPRRIQTCHAKFFLQKVQSGVKNLVRLYSSRVSKVKLNSYLRLWINQSRKLKGVQELKRRTKESEEKFKKESMAKATKLEKLEEKLQHRTSESAQLKENERHLRSLLKEREDKERALKDSIERLKKKDGEDRKAPRNVEDRIQALESHVLNLKTENSELKEKLEQCETNIGGFVQEMNECLDCIEISKIEDLDINELQDFDIEEKQGGGTGGYTRKKNVPIRREVSKASDKARKGPINPKYKLQFDQYINGNNNFHTAEN